MTKILRIFNKILLNHGSSTNILLKQNLRSVINLTKYYYSSENSSNVKNKKSPLYRQLYSKMMTCGPLSVAEYMKEILTHPNVGYYMTKDVFGLKGDFITSPEISQLFGEIIAVWIINEWIKISKDPFQLVELGPGKGTLIQDVLRVFKKLQFLNKISIHLVEISPALSKIQAQNLCTHVEEINLADSKTQIKENSIGHYKKGITEDGIEIYWYYSVTDIPKKFSIFLAHEFFDALPIHKFQKTDQGWSEVLVDVIPGIEEEKFRYVLSKGLTPAARVYISEDESRDHVEISPQSLVIIDYISSFLMECGGFALIIDYGHIADKTDTFRAFRKHKLHDPLLNPGSADLTADVDFSLIQKIALKDNRVISFGPISQRTFLKNLGIDLRLEMILKNSTDVQKEQILSGYHMIMDADKMGERFKVLSLFPYVLSKYMDKWKVDGFKQENKNEQLQK
ncbi:PREDICTED: NADH dehydrogenase [ubiquinone] complex I, assembly factor 7 isoform X2 [Polistes dominula]|nr:PREDICTED: NADH dehydrogenase [ubiquinone] complex I, assembly factor 7 isoform X2 [Polistes dominula]